MEGILACPEATSRILVDAASDEGVFGPIRGQGHTRAAAAAHAEVRGGVDKGHVEGRTGDDGVGGENDRALESIVFRLVVQRDTPELVVGFVLAIRDQEQSLDSTEDDAVEHGSADDQGRKQSSGSTFHDGLTEGRMTEVAQEVNLRYGISLCCTLAGGYTCRMHWTVRIFDRGRLRPCEMTDPKSVHWKTTLDQQPQRGRQKRVTLDCRHFHCCYQRLQYALPSSVASLHQWPYDGLDCVKTWSVDH